MLKLPKISFIVTCFNLSPYIEECLLSILNQTYKNIEIIVVNDKSTDDSQMIIENFIKSHPQIKLINNQENLGQLGSALEGIKVSTGEFVANIDADDVLLDEYANIHIQTHLNSSVAFTSCQQIEIDQNSIVHTLNSPASPKKKKDLYNLKIKKIEDILNLKADDIEIEILNSKKQTFGDWHWGPTSTGVIRKSVLEFCLLYKDHKNWRKGADKFLFSFAHLIGSSAIIHTPLVAYRQQPANLSCANPVLGDTKYLKPETIKLYVGYNKRIRQDMLKFIQDNYAYFCQRLNPINTNRIIKEIIFSVDLKTIRKAIKSLFVK